ncbi:hypothetical protein PG997_013531 [Apiospora hydei]|uniref:LCCL domain-containing protein n=1 Tax=Apiospora hydei TaxID=1337664 RepID=A0ABR1V9P9_9PEZI
MGGDNRDESVQVVSDVESSEPSRSDSHFHHHPDAPIAQAGQLDIDDNANLPTPRFMQDEGAWKRWKWVPYPARKLITKVTTWSRGPPEPKDWKINPLFPAVQHAPIWLLERYLPKTKYKVWLFMGYVVIWILTFCLVMRQGLLSSEVTQYGVPSDISCGTTYWMSGNQCGLDGSACRPFSGSGFAFKCPANCASYRVLNPRAVGTQEVVYQPLVVGGPTDGGNVSAARYRGDSFICGSAIHAGGCGVVQLDGQHTGFPASPRNGIASIGFDSYFPLSFGFPAGFECSSKDVRWPLLAVSVTFTAVLSLFTTSAPLFFFPVFIGVFWQVGMASDAPSHTSIAGLFSNILGKFLPAMFVAWVMYDKMGVKRTLRGLTAQVEKTVLWLGGCWVGALTNYTFDFIPIQRLNAHDLQQQPGAKAALAIIIIVLVVVMVSQVWYFRQEGRLTKFLKLYLLFIIGIVICLVLPDLSLRIHHYILALLLLPGTSMQTRPSLLYQGILMGLFINGIARWGFDSVLQTSTALQGDGQFESPLPNILAPVIALNAPLWNVTFNWGPSPGPEFDGISILVNDVERFRSYFGDDDAKYSFTWTRNSSLNLDEYFRFGYMDGSSSWDYSKAGTWTPAGDWVEMAPGPSKVKARSFDGESPCEAKTIGLPMTVQ